MLHKPKKIRIGTRKSKLAVCQTELVAKAISKYYDGDIEFEIVMMSTIGDQMQDRPLSAIGGKGLFTAELEDSILSGKVDMAVHSGKDMPMEVRKGLEISPVLKREDPSDMLVSDDDIDLSSDVSGLCLGTSSLRRKIQISGLNPGFDIKDIRGNVLTRLTKLVRGDYNAIILASAGINRLADKFGTDLYDGFHMKRMDPRVFLPAAAQGILALETREGEFKDLIAAISDKDSNLAFYIERKFLESIDADCNAPYGIYTDVIDEEFVHIYAMYATDKRRYLDRKVRKDKAVAEAANMAEELLNAGK